MGVASNAIKVYIVYVYRFYANIILYFSGDLDTSLPIHTVQPQITNCMFNAYDYNPNNSNGSESGEDKLTVRLIRAHGMNYLWMKEWLLIDW